MKVGDLVVRTYGEGQRPVALLIGWWNPGAQSDRLMAEVIWVGGSGRIVQFGAKYLEAISESR
jgi:hypothetical protein